MAVTVGQVIGEAEYTTLRSGINLVMGTPTGTGAGAAGYNETTTSPAVAPGDKITAAAWNALKADVDIAYKHQTGALPDPALATVNTDSGITKTVHDALETVVNFVKDPTNRFLIGAGQFSTVSASSKVKPAGWNGILIHDVTFTWATGDEAKAFFNAGGKLIFSSAMSYTGTQTKTVDWKNMIAGVGTVTMDHISVTKTGASGTIINDGFYDLTTTARYLVSKAGTTPYSENDYQIEARSITNGVRIRMIYRDDDAGDQQAIVGAGPAGPAVDENVLAAVTSAMSYIRPIASGGVTVSAPTIADGGTTTTW